MKRKIYAEAAYLLGLLILAVGTALMERADFGMSMVVAPAYLLHLKLSQIFPWFTFGAAEYTLQAVLLLLMFAVLRRFRLYYLFSFVTAVVYGIMLDLVMIPSAMLPVTLVTRTVYFVAGLLLGSLAISLLFHTYIAPEVYELFVKEVSEKYGFPIGRCKTVYDCTSCGFSVLLSFAFFGFGHFEGIKLGTVLCALINGWIIGRITVYLEKHFSFPRLIPEKKQMASEFCLFCFFSVQKTIDGTVIGW